VATALAEAGYEGVIAMEAFAAADPELALRRFRDAFTVPCP
jgi:hydroxypyruvate isomerase